MTSLDPLSLYKCLSEETRLSVMLLLLAEGELCVCEMTAVLQLSQPKVSRHLAELRRCGLLADRREGQWVYYRLIDDLPKWAMTCLRAGYEGRQPAMNALGARLASMGDRPQRRDSWC
ncbi:MAG: metalloregulator ArsR/SmtB family transcription factor [Pseudomonadota bacterium]|nr:metalloregulator ArsR/SmtB family transcription factor [Pseudomonadota bacterium]